MLQQGIRFIGEKWRKGVRRERDEGIGYTRTLPDDAVDLSTSREREGERDLTTTQAQGPHSRSSASRTS